MSYIQKTLRQGEVVIHTASLHWIMLVKGPVLLLAGIFLGVYVPDSPPALKVVAILAGVFFFISDLIRYLTTEIAITSDRLIYKRGLVWRSVRETRLSKIEGVDVDQSVLGRILRYGRVSISGTGSKDISFKPIANPLRLRRYAVEEFSVPMRA